MNIKPMYEQSRLLSSALPKQLKRLTEILEDNGIGFDLYREDRNFVLDVYGHYRDKYLEARFVSREPQVLLDKLIDHLKQL